jgi:hypothetical protein
LGTGVSTFLATPSSANLKTAVTDETGSGALVFATSPTLVTPVLGTPSSGTLTSCTGLPVSTGISGLGSNVATFLATPSSANLAAAVTNETGTGALVFATSPALTTPNLGTPSAATLTNATGLPVATGISGLGSGVATFLATPSSANLRTAVTDETGSGALVFATSPTLVTPVLGVATATSVQGIIGNVTPAAGTFTTLTANGNTTLGDAAGDITTVPDLKALQVTSADRHSVRPSLLLDFANTKTLDPRITFTRASTATFYDGKTVAKAEENLLSYSQEFDNAYWSKDNGTVTANNTTAPDGTTTAELFIPNTTSTFHRITRTAVFSSAGKAFYSIYVKASGYDIVGIRESTSVGASYTFNLATGTVGVQNGAAADPSITSVGDGWYRISISATITGNVGFSVHVLDGSYVSGSLTSYSWAGDGTSGIYVWGAQLEQRSSVTAYTATTTAPITNYIPALQTAASGVARFEHNPVTGESLGLEIEEQRTNIALQSEDFTTTWTVSATSVSSNTIIAPNGTLTGDKLVLNNAASLGGYVGQTITAAATTYTCSCYAKIGEYNRVQLFVRGNATAVNNASVTFSLVDGSIITAAAVSGTFTGASATSTNVGNGWYRLTLTFTSTGETAVRARVLVLNSVATTGDGYSGIYIWGAQVEAGAFATSYIPTTTAQVTRSADAASMTGTNFSSWYRADEGSLYAESEVLSTALANSMVFTISDSAIGALQSSNLITIRNVRAVGNAGNTVSASGAAQADISIANTDKNKKQAFAYKVNDFAASVNNSAVSVDTLGTVPVGVNQAAIGSSSAQAGAGSLNGTIKKIAYYPKRLTNAELVSLSTV